nr:MAG TPA: hypothetical protein [Caudoviricetes sp.]
MSYLFLSVLRSLWDKRLIFPLPSVASSLYSINRSKKISQEKPLFFCIIVMDLS